MKRPPHRAISWSEAGRRKLEVGKWAGPCLWSARHSKGVPPSSPPSAPPDAKRAHQCSHGLSVKAVASRRPWPPELWEAAARRSGAAIEIVPTLHGTLALCRGSARAWAFDLPSLAGGAPKRYVSWRRRRTLRRPCLRCRPSIGMRMRWCALGRAGRTSTWSERAARASSSRRMLYRRRGGLSRGAPPSRCRAAAARQGHHRRGGSAGLAARRQVQPPRDPPGAHAAGY